MKENEKKEPIIDDALKWHFFNLYCMALSDEEFDFTERQVLYEIGLEHGLSPEEINKVILTANITPTIPATTEDKVEYLYDLAKMAWADGKIEPEERAVIKKCIIRYGFLPANADGIADYFLECIKNNKTKTDILNEING